ncbi:MAG: HAD family hydrolase [Candidatus Nanopelagicales bacterium]
MTESGGAQRTAAFFDVDNTLLRGATLYYLARGLAARDLVTWRQIIRYAWKQWKFLTSGKEHVKDLKFVTDTSMAFIGGRDQLVMLDVCQSVVDEIMLNKLWPGTLRIARAHLERGEEVWLVTAAPNDVAGMLAERLGLTGGLGTCAEVKDGRYTGHILGTTMHGQAKAEAIQRIAAERQLDLTRSTAYSDSSNDLPMLSAVGNAVAVNPDGALRRLARRKGWLIVEYRRTRAWRDTQSPANPNMAVGAGIAAGLAAAALGRKRRK